MREYVKKNAVLDVGQYRLYELKISGVKNGEVVLDFTEANELLEVGEVETPVETLEGEND